MDCPKSVILPTGNPIDILDFKGKKIECSLTKIGNPTIFINSKDVEGLIGDE